MKKLYFMLLALLIGSLPNLTASADTATLGDISTKISAAPGNGSTYDFVDASGNTIRLYFATGARVTTTTPKSVNLQANKTVKITLLDNTGNPISFNKVELLNYVTLSPTAQQTVLASGEPGTFDYTSGVWTNDTPVESITFMGYNNLSSLKFSGLVITYGEGEVVKTPKLHAYYTGSTSDFTTFSANGSANYNVYKQTILVKGENLTGDVTLTSSNPAMLTATPATLTAEEAMAGTNVTLTFCPTATSDAPTMTISSEDAKDVVVNTSATYADLYAGNFTSDAFSISKGETQTLAFSLPDAKQFVSYQTNITLPAGLTIAADGVTTNSANHTVAYNAKDGVYTVVVYSPNNNNFTDDAGILNLNLVADDTFAGGNITLSNNVMTFADGAVAFPGYYPADVTVETKVFVAMTGVTLAPATSTIELGKDVQLTATIEPAEAADQVKEIKWSSSETNVATVYNGLVSSVGAGKTTITVTVTASDDTQYTATAEVIVAGIESVKVTPAEKTLYLGGDTLELTAEVTVAPEDADIDTNVKWDTTNDQVATVEVKDGKVIVTPVGVGIATISATAGSDVNNQKTGYATITVHAAESMEIGSADDQTTLNVGETLTLTSSSKPTNVAVNWTSSDNEIATVDENGVVTGVKAGDVTITATAKDDPTVKATINLTIAGVTGVTVNPATAALCVGGATTTLEATVAVYPEDAEFSKEVTWTSSDETIATVDENGVVKGLKAGEVTITATSVADAKFKATATITVGVTTGITIDLGAGQEDTVDLGGTVTLTAKSEPAGAAPVEWSCEPADAATIVTNADGSVTITTKKVGELTITATATDGSGVTATKTINVAGVTAIELTAASTTVNMGKTLELTADVTIFPEDALISTDVDWTCEPAGAVTFVKNDDVSKVTVTPVTPGKVTITATAKDGSEVKGEIEITITNFMQTLKFKADSEVMKVGDEMILSDAVTYTPEEPEDATLVFTSDNAEVADVVEGKLVAKSVGTANITVSNEASGLEATMTVTVRESDLLGDANGDGVVDIADVTGEVQYIIGTWPEDKKFYESNADVNEDGDVNVVDVTLTVDIVLSETNTVNEMLANASQVNVSGLNVADVNLDETNVMTIALGNISGISAMQADLTMPEGVKVKNITVANGMNKHVVSFKRHGEDRVRLAMYSLSLAEVEENSAMLVVELESEGTFDERFAQISNIFAATTESELINFEPVSVKMSKTSSIDAIYADLEGGNIYTTTGILLKRNASLEDIKALTPGLYIIGGKKVLVK